MIDIKKETKEKYEKGLKLYLENDVSLTQISKQLKIHRGRMTEFIRDQGIEIINNQNKLNVNPSVFKIIDTEEKAYWLGFIYADGYSKNGAIEIGLGIKDYNHLKKFANFIDYKKPIKLKENQLNGKTYKSARVFFRCAEMSRDLRNLGCESPKSLTLTFPSEEQVPSKFHTHFIRGYIDGDGWLNVDDRGYPRISFLGTESFTKSCVKAMNWHKTEIRKSKNVFVVEYGGWQVYEMIKPLYENSTIYLDRKYENYLKIKNAVLNRNI